MAKSSRKYMPRPDGAFSSWADAFDVAVHEWWGTQRLDPAALEPFEKAIDNWRTACPEHIAAARAASEIKEHIRADLEQAVRPLAKFICSNVRKVSAHYSAQGPPVEPGEKTESVHQPLRGEQSPSSLSKRKARAIARAFPSILFHRNSALR